MSFIQHIMKSIMLLVFLLSLSTTSTASVGVSLGDSQILEIALASNVYRASSDEPIERELSIASSFNVMQIGWDDKIYSSDVGKNLVIEITEIEGESYTMSVTYPNGKSGVVSSTLRLPHEFIHRKSATDKSFMRELVVQNDFTLTTQAAYEDYMSVLSGNDLQSIGISTLLYEETDDYVTLGYVNEDIDNDGYYSSEMMTYDKTTGFAAKYEEHSTDDEDGDGAIDRTIDLIFAISALVPSVEVTSGDLASGEATSDESESLIPIWATVVTLLPLITIKKRLVQSKYVQN